MASILRQIVAGPRAQHPEAGLDLCYVTDNIIATSGPGATYPQLAYRNPLKDLVKFLDSKHGEKWAIWEFRAEGTGYPDSEVYGRVWHYPWPDHHPPPFALIPLIMGSMRNWLKDKDAEGRVVVVHCKAGKGRSGTIACSYLISEEGWKPEDAVQRFTERRMRPGFGVGISIPSQQRWIRYVNRWTQNGKRYVERPVEILEVHVWGLRDGVKIVVEGYVDEGKVIKKFHTFQSNEREVIRGGMRDRTGFSDVALEMMRRNNAAQEKKQSGNTTDQESNEEKQTPLEAQKPDSIDSDVVFRPSSRVVLPSSDINIDFERRNKTRYGGFTMVTSVAHVWFNTFFEGGGPEKEGNPDNSGLFEIEWDAMDGIKGSSRKGTRAFDKFAVVWKALDLNQGPNVVVSEPAEGEPVPQAKPADWRYGTKEESGVPPKRLGLREDDSQSDVISRASSMHSQSARNGDNTNDSADELAGVKSDIRNSDEDSNSAEQTISNSNNPSNLRHATSAPDPTDNTNGTDPVPQTQLDGTPELTNKLQHISTSDLPGGVPESSMEDADNHPVGSIVRDKGSGTSS